MSRSGYSDDIDNWAFIKWRGQVASAIRGKRGQALLHDLASAMDAMPDKVLISNALQQEGAYCALGAVGAKRGIDLKCIDPYDQEQVSKSFDVAIALACEIMFINDEEAWTPETPEQRWKRVRAWVAEQLLGDDGKEEK